MDGRTGQAREGAVPAGCTPPAGTAKRAGARVLPKGFEPHVVLAIQYKPLMVHLRRRLASYIRQKRGDTPQREFARKIGVAQSTIMRIENQDQNVTLTTLEALCRVFNVDVADLFPAIEVSRPYRPAPPHGLNVPAPNSRATLHEAPPGTPPGHAPVTGRPKR